MPDGGAPVPQASPPQAALAQARSAEVELLVATVRAELRALADPERAPGQQAYMKSQMPFLGVRVPEVRKTVAAYVRQAPPSDIEVVMDAAARLWREAQHREERYTATALTGTRYARARLEPLGLQVEMVRSGAWWDHTDELAGQIGATALAHPATMHPILREWMHHADPWLRRVSIIWQVGHKAATLPHLLTEAIEANASSTDFFHRKAIGWALRDYAKTEPEWVRAYVAASSGKLSGLSKREALKHL